MNRFLKKVNASIRSFTHKEDGAQVVEYALIIAVVSIALVVALGALAGPSNPFDNFIARVATCLTTAASCI